MWKFALILFCLMTAGTALAQQPNPTVEIVLSQPTASMGQTVIAEVYVRGAVNIAGTDIGITVDPTCLRISDRQTGGFLPTEAEQRGFSAFSELNEHDTRLAASLLKDGPIANGDGVFFRATLEVTCDTGVAPLNVSFVELTGIVDPAAENAEYVVYKVDMGNVTTVNTQLTIVPAGEVTLVPTNALEVTPVAPTTTPDVAPVDAVDATAPQDQTLMIVALSIMGIAVIGLVILVVVDRRRRNRRN